MKANHPQHAAAVKARPSSGVAPAGSSAGTPESPKPPARRSFLWLWFVGAFLLQAGAWTTWFIIAGKHRVEEVPLVTSAPAKVHPPSLPAHNAGSPAATDR